MGTFPGTSTHFASGPGRFTRGFPTAQLRRNRHSESSRPFPPDPSGSPSPLSSFLPPSHGTAAPAHLNHPTVLPWVQARVRAPGHVVPGAGPSNTQLPELLRAGSASRPGSAGGRWPRHLIPAPGRGCRRATAAPRSGGVTEGRQPAAPPDPWRRCLTPASAAAAEPRSRHGKAPSPNAATLSPGHHVPALPPLPPARPVPEKSASAATSALHTRIRQERRRRSRPGSTCLRRGCCPASPSLMVRERAAPGRGGKPVSSHDGAGPGWRRCHPRPAGHPPPRGSAGCPGTALAAGRRRRRRAEQPCPRPRPQRSRPPPRREWVPVGVGSRETRRRRCGGARGGGGAGKRLLGGAVPGTALNAHRAGRADSDPAAPRPPSPGSLHPSPGSSRSRHLPLG